MWFAWLMRWVSRYHEPLVAAWKRRIFSGITGPVLEIGPGHGVNFAYYPAGLDWAGYEPNRHLAADIESPGLIVAPYEGQLHPCHTAVSTLVLCSVTDPARVLSGLFASLPSGGRLLFLEHVAATEGSPLRAAQARWLPVWRCCAGGCHPDRDAARAIKTAGFEIEWIEEFRLPLWLATPHIAGVARKP